MLKWPDDLDDFSSVCKDRTNKNTSSQDVACPFIIQYGDNSMYNGSFLTDLITYDHANLARANITFG